MDTIKRYRELYADMSTSNDPMKMKIFGKAEQWAFEQIAASSPAIARQWLEKIEACEWNNYMSEQEAAAVTSEFINQNGKSGPMWSLAQIESLGLRMEDEPYYNKYALYTTMNMLASDHWVSISEYLPEENIPGFIYKMAVEKLTDRDRPRFVRDYFDI